jgi:hypothetical protein
MVMSYRSVIYFSIGSSSIFRILKTHINAFYEVSVKDAKSLIELNSYGETSEIAIFASSTFWSDSVFNLFMLYWSEPI